MCEQAQQKTARQIFKLLNIDPPPKIFSNTIKQTPHDLRRIIKNYDEILQCLKNSPYQNELIAHNAYPMDNSSLINANF